MITLKNKINLSEDNIKEIEFLEQQIFLHNGYTLENLTNLFQSKNFYCLFFENNNQNLGYCLFFENNDEAEIYKIGVVYEYRNKNIGSELLTYLKQKYNSIYLEVSDRDNTLHFYLKNKFKVIHQRNNYYSDNSNAYILKWIR